MIERTFDLNEEGAVARKGTDQRILEAAERLFSQRGFHATGMRAIARAARVSLGTIYHHFKSKEEVLLAIIAKEYRKRREALEELRDQDLPLAELIRRIVDLHFRRLLRAGDVLRPLAQSLGGISARARRRILALRREFVDYLADLIREGIERGQIRPCDPLVAAHAFLGMVEAVSARALGEDEVARHLRERGPEELTGILWRALAPDVGKEDR